MQFGVFFLIQYPRTEISIPTRYEEVFEQVALAEELGFDIAWFAEHHFSNYGLSTNPLMLAVRAAERTRRIRLAPAVLVVPFYHPLRLAEDVALADVFSNGRLTVGVGRGYQPYEFDRFGVRIEESRELFAEAVDLMVTAWTRRGFTHQGRHWQIPECTIYPRPIQQPHPPVWVAANTPETIRFAVERGFHVITTGGVLPSEPAARVGRAVRAAEAAAGRPPGSSQFGLQRAVYVADSAAEARAHVQDALWTHRVTIRSMRGIVEVRDGIVAADPLPDEPAPEDVYEQVLFGTPDEVAAKLRAQIEATGADLINCYFGPGAIPHQKTLRSMRLFAEEVLPRFAGEPLAARG